MKRYKVKTPTEELTKEALELFSALGYEKEQCNLRIGMVGTFKNKVYSDYLKRFDGYDYKGQEITIEQLRDMVVLHRNDVNDATHEVNNRKYYLTRCEFFEYNNGKWINVDEFVDGVSFVEINKECEMKKYLTKNIKGGYVVVDHHSGFDIDQLILIPEGAEIALKAYDSACNIHFWKGGGKYIYRGDWLECSEISHTTVDKFKEVWKDHKVVWQEVSNNITKNNVQNDINELKVEWFEEFLNGVKVQYRIGDAVGSETSQWCNMTYNALKNLQHSPIEFREAPKYVVLNGITFKDKESLIRHIANNYNLD